MRNLPKYCAFVCADLGSNAFGRLFSPDLVSWKRNIETGEFEIVRGSAVSPNARFDVVSIQFSIHYLMSSEKRARCFFMTVGKLLDVGGNLIVTTIDARVVLEHLLDLGIDLHVDKDSSQKGALIQLGGGACHLQFDGDTLTRLFSSNDGNQDIFGLRYLFTLVEGSNHAAGVGDAVNLPEYLTPIPLLQSLAEEVGLELELVENFHEIYNNRRDPCIHPDAHFTMDKMKVLNRNGSISADEWEISRLYCVLKFRKIREKTTTVAC